MSYSAYEKRLRAQLAAAIRWNNQKDIEYFKYELKRHTLQTKIQELQHELAQLGTEAPGRH